MTREPDPLHDLFSPLRSCRFAAGEHRNRLEKTLMDTIARRRSRLLWFGAATLALVGMAAAATEWWEQYQVAEHDNGDGTYQLTVTDGAGTVEFDETLPNDTAVLHVEGGTYIVVEPSAPGDAEVDAALRELDAGAKDGDR